MPHRNNSSFGIALVTAQFSILGYFALFHPIRQAFGPQDIVAFTLITAGILLGASALLAHRAGHFRIVPEPDSETTLIMTGPYAFIRHPMYTALILFTFGLFVNYPVIGHFLAFSLLFIVLNMKIAYEERLLTEHFPEYPEYQRSTHRLLPFIY